VFSVLRQTHRHYVSRPAGQTQWYYSYMNQSQSLSRTVITVCALVVISALVAFILPFHAFDFSEPTSWLNFSGEPFKLFAFSFLLFGICGWLVRYWYVYPFVVYLAGNQLRSTNWYVKEGLGPDNIRWVIFGLVLLACCTFFILTRLVGSRVASRGFRLVLIVVSVLVGVMVTSIPLKAVTAHYDQQYRAILLPGSDSISTTVSQNSLKSVYAYVTYTGEPQLPSPHMQLLPDNFKITTLLIGKQYDFAAMCQEALNTTEPLHQKSHDGITYYERVWDVSYQYNPSVKVKAGIPYTGYQDYFVIGRYFYVFTRHDAQNIRSGSYPFEHLLDHLKKVDIYAPTTTESLTVQ
jgi:hypothetical protein